MEPLDLEQENVSEIAGEARRLILQLRAPLVDLVETDHTPSLRYCAPHRGSFEDTLARTVS
jgi:hypothetical protein